MKFSCYLNLAFAENRQIARYVFKFTSFPALLANEKYKPRALDLARDNPSGAGNQTQQNRPYSELLASALFAQTSNITDQILDLRIR
jgi:hypothetical protein